MPQPLIELGGKPDAPIFHIAPANGFVPQTYLPLARHFTTAYRVVCLPPRALWGADYAAPQATITDDWTQVADDLEAGFNAQGWRNIVAVGHSFGGVATMLVALRQPDLFKALILLDPTIPPPHVMKMFLEARRQGIAIPLATGALRRRRDFASVDDAYENFRSKGVFSQWSDEAVRLYAEYGTQHNGTDQRTLAWSPEWEAYYFNSVYPHSWEIVTQLDGLLPVLVVRGGSSDTYTQETAQKIAQLLPRAMHQTVDGHGHLFPQSAPDETAHVMREWLKTI
jgi:pimeloyl-ACP methyl ester carboxylesterase